MTIDTNSFFCLLILAGISAYIALRKDRIRKEDDEKYGTSLSRRTDIQDWWGGVKILAFIIFVFVLSGAITQNIFQEKGSWEGIDIANAKSRQRLKEGIVWLRAGAYIAILAITIFSSIYTINGIAKAIALDKEEKNAT